MNADQLAQHDHEQEDPACLLTGQVHIDDPLVVEKRIGVLDGQRFPAALELDSRKTSTSIWSIRLPMTLHQARSKSNDGKKR
jgi:hypothetical protein